MLNVYYNDKGIGDVLLVTVDAGQVEERGHEKSGDVVKLVDQKDGRTIGFNIFNASNHFNVKGNGKVDITDQLVKEINTFLHKNNIDETIEFDSRPEFIVGYVENKEKHPDADKLSVCQVDIGSEKLQIVCGAPNIDKGQKVVVSRVGAVMPSGTLIKEAELRGVKSFGMICSAKELDLPNAPQEKGILVLDDSYEVGSDFFAENK
ncbi:YtpR family tRNA-binding protein [Pseudalkalibacillus sp. SCS-8]|uniref:YtpR family tRNA-binding protein n=1 Tax=Pseudalkalibacillus nanhaiensis TaxID=3115291 RepID=UPI0032DA35B2